MLLRILHSYQIVKGLTAREEHINAARMLVTLRISDMRFWLFV
jgi:hypothetical protein